MQQSYDVKSHLGTTEVLLVIKNSMLLGHLLTSCHINRFHKAQKVGSLNQKATFFLIKFLNLPITRVWVRRLAERVHSW